MSLDPNTQAEPILEDYTTELPKGIVAATMTQTLLTLYFLSLNGREKEILTVTGRDGTLEHRVVVQYKRNGADNWSVRAPGCRPRRLLENKDQIHKGFVLGGATDEFFSRLGDYSNAHRANSASLNRYAKRIIRQLALAERKYS